MKHLAAKIAAVVLICAPAVAFGQTLEPRPTPAPVDPYTVGVSPSPAVSVPPPGITPEPGNDGISTKARDESYRTRCVPGAACETDGTFRNIEK